MFGIGAVSGVAMGKAHIVRGSVARAQRRGVSDTDAELTRLSDTLAKAKGQLSRLIEKADETFSEIIEYQMLMLDDEDFVGKMKAAVTGENVNCEYAVDSVCGAYMAMFENMENEYLQQRAVDIEDIRSRVLNTLSGVDPDMSKTITVPSIIAGVDLTPTQTSTLDRSLVKGIVMEKGGVSSHSVIIARSIGVPCIIGAEGLLEALRDGDTVAMDGGTGEVVVSPSGGDVSRFERLMEREAIESARVEKYRTQKGITLDGVPVGVLCNITSLAEAEAVVAQGGEGVGLLRTEFLYLAGDEPPGEDAQADIYAAIAKKLLGRTLIIRTLDAGGDKQIGYLGIPEEDNPFLGYRAIRFCLDNPEFFKVQLRAIWRAGAHGDIGVMFPMVADVTELRRAKTLLGQAKEELLAQGVAVGAVKTGVMIETPASVTMADVFAKEVDFFSVGTNDLTQYLFAADRVNPKVSGLNTPYHPALLRSVMRVCECAMERGVEVDICGQAGEEPDLVPLWVAMGVHKLSVSVPAVAKVRERICTMSQAEAKGVLARVLDMAAADEVKKFLQEVYK